MEQTLLLLCVMAHTTHVNEYSNIDNRYLLTSIHHLFKAEASGLILDIVVTQLRETW